MYTCPFTKKQYRYGPPAGYVTPKGQVNWGPDEWDALVARGLHFEPYDGPRTVSRSYGTCLWPLLPGHEKYLELRPLAAEDFLKDGGLYIIEPENQEEMRKVIKERLGRSIEGRVGITKFLRYIGFEWWYINREGIDALRDGIVTHEVVGFIPKSGPNAGVSSTPTTHGGPPVYFEAPESDQRRAVLAGAVGAAAMLLAGCGDSEAQASHCNRQPFAADSPECSTIGLNAATSTSTSSLSASGLGSFTTPSTVGSITVGPFPVATTVILTVTGQWNFTFTGGSAQNIVLRYGISTTTSTFSGALVTVDQSSSALSTVSGLGPLSQEIQVALAANTTTTYNVLAGENPSGVVGTAIAISGVIKAEVIKR